MKRKHLGIALLLFTNMTFGADSLFSETAVDWKKKIQVKTSIPGTEYILAKRLSFTTEVDSDFGNGAWWTIKTTGEPSTLCRLHQEDRDIKSGEYIEKGTEFTFNKVQSFKNVRDWIIFYVDQPNRYNISKIDCRVGPELNRNNNIHFSIEE